MRMLGQCSSLSMLVHGAAACEGGQTPRDAHVDLEVLTDFELPNDVKCLHEFRVQVVHLNLGRARAVGYALWGWVSGLGFGI